MLDNDGVIGEQVISYADRTDKGQCHVEPSRQGKAATKNLSRSCEKTADSVTSNKQTTVDVTVICRQRSVALANAAEPTATKKTTSSKDC
jgi:hypothetical protein